MRISWTSLFAAILFLGSLRAEGLAFKWRTEVSSAAPYDAQAMQGESFTLEATLVQYGQPMAGEATATFYYQTKDMEKHQWYTAPAAWASATGTVSATWTPAMDVGTTAYRWFFGVDTAEGKNYRVFGTLRLKASPGFSPATLTPTDIRAELTAEILAELQAWAEGTLATQEALDSEAAAREEADGAITEAVNAIQDDLSTHNHDGAYLKLTGGTMSGTILSALSKASDPGLTITLGQGDRYYAKHTQAGIQARRALSDPEEFYAFFSVSGTNQIARLGDLEPLATKAALAAKAEATHNHEMGDVDGLETALAAKAALEHTHSQYLTAESDPTVSAWAKAATKPTYTAAEVGAQPAGKYVTYDTTHLTELGDTDAVSKETLFTGGIRTDSFKTLAGTPFFNTAPYYGFNITGFYRLNGYKTENNPLLEWDVKTQKSKLAVTTVYEGGTSLSNKYAPISHEHTVSAITDFPTTWDWANLTNKPTAFTPAAHNHAIADTTGLQAALEALAPLSAVTCTTNNVTYIWQWDEAAGTFALVER